MGKFNDFGAISCPKPAFCAAVGSDGSGTQTQTLAATWTVFKPANPGADTDQLNGVACPTAATCQAVGDFVPDASDDFQTLTETAITLVPLIKNFTPTSGQPGSTVTINGDHFGGVTKGYSRANLGNWCISGEIRQLLVKES